MPWTTKQPEPVPVEAAHDFTAPNIRIQVYRREGERQWNAHGHVDAYGLLFDALGHADLEAAKVDALKAMRDVAAKALETLDAAIAAQGELQPQ